MSRERSTFRIRLTNTIQFKYTCSNNYNASGCTSDERTKDDNFHDRSSGNTVLHAMDFREYNQIL